MVGSSENELANAFEGRRKALQDVLIDLHDECCVPLQEAGLQGNQAPWLFPKMNDMRPYLPDQRVEMAIDMEIPAEWFHMREQDWQDMGSNARIPWRICYHSATKLLPLLR